MTEEASWMSLQTDRQTPVSRPLFQVNLITQFLKARCSSWCQTKCECYYTRTLYVLPSPVSTCQKWLWATVTDWYQNHVFTTVHRIHVQPSACRWCPSLWVSLTHSLTQVICWEAGVWLQTLNNFCHSFPIFSCSFECHILSCHICKKTYQFKTLC